MAASKITIIPDNLIAGNSFIHEYINELKTVINQNADEIDTKEEGDTISPATNTADYIPQWNGTNSKTLKNGVAVPDGGLAGLTALGLKEDKVAGKGLSTNDYDNTEKGYVAKIIQPDVGTLVTGSNDINLSSLSGQEYHPYDMASGALTLVADADPAPVRNGYAYGIIISDATNVPNVTAFTLLTGTYSNINNVENHYIIYRKYNASDVLTNYIEWKQPD